VTADESSPLDPPAAAVVTDSGDAKADRGGVANPGIIIGDVRSEYHEHRHYQPAVVTWPILVGQPPALASAFQARRAVRQKIQDAAQPGTRILAGGGGVGKSQLAAWFAHRALDEQTADLVLWVPAGNPEQIITAYSRAAQRVGVPGADGTDPATDAAGFREWLHTTDRTWLIVLDDIADPAHLAGWWPPHVSAGWTVATTRLQDSTLVSADRWQVDITVYSPAEAVAYLTDRLADAGYPDLLDDGAARLASTLGYLPLALCHAAAYMIYKEVGCTSYLTRYTAAATMTEVMFADRDPDGYSRPVAVTLLLALDAADRAAPAGLARPAIALAAVLDPAGHPDALWATTAITDYLSAHRTVDAGTPVTADQADGALRLLHRYGLLTHRRTDGARAVRIQAPTARATREATTIDPAIITWAAADALLALWPEHDYATTDLVDALRTNTTTLAGVAGDLLWRPDGHPLLYEAGYSLLRSGLHTGAIGYWRRMVDDAMRVLGDEHPSTITARADLASSYWQGGRTGDAIIIEEKVVDDARRVLGDEHPDTLTARANLAVSYRQAGRTGDAIPILEKVLDDRARVLGEEHPDTLTARNSLAVSYAQAGRIGDAIPILEKVVDDRARVRGDEHPETLTARANLAVCYRQAGRTGDAISILEKVVDDKVRVLGDEHPDTLTARINLAVCYRQAGRTGDAITIEEKVVDDARRVLGDEHPDTLTARAHLAISYQHAGRTGDAITILEKVVDDARRVLGDKHPSTVAAVDALQAWQAEA
jgi:tetratricopeptide (TPR) repeat protein